MSNVKIVQIEGELPTFWMSGLVDHDNSATTDEAAFIASMFLNPVYGLWLDFTGEERREGLENGGSRTWHGFHIHGAEAISWRALDRLVAILHRVGRVMSAGAQDIEDKSAPPERINPDDALVRDRQRVEA